jgi:hypothetical protein
VMWFTSPAVSGVGVMLAAVLGIACGARDRENLA